MPKSPLQQVYRDRVVEFESAIGRQNQVINLLAVARLLLLAGSTWLLIRGLSLNSLSLYLGSAAALLAFFVLIIIHAKHKNRRALLKELRTLNLDEELCLEHDFHHLPTGSKYASNEHPWSHDLDLFGDASLFQYMNRTGTLQGEKQLAEMLCTTPGNSKTIRNRQELIRDLAGRIDFRQQIVGRGKLVKEDENDVDEISRWLENSAYIGKYSFLFYLAIAVSLLSLSIIVAGIFNPALFKLLLYVLIFNFSLLSPFLARTNRYQVIISKKTQVLQGYSGLLKTIAGESFNHPRLQEESEKALSGTREVAKLSRLLGMFDQRLNMLMGAILNGLFLYDFIMLHLLERWKKKHQDEIMVWIELLGRTDALVSLAGFAYNHPGFAYPELSEDEKEVRMEELGHPLIPDKKRVHNSLELGEEKVVVVTGANMAGKSTYLRALGVNLVLAYTGCPVCATSFIFPYVDLYSSMRTADSLKDEESYFLAEIKKLGSIVTKMEEGRPMLILLDEVLKGTNTTDKKLGSIGLIEKTLRYPVRCFIATHDLSLGDLEKQYKGQVVNYCFESYIRDMELSFDYTIRSGLATNMNASFLMKKMGIMD